MDSNQGILVVGFENNVPAVSRYIQKDDCTLDAQPDKNCSDALQLECPVNCLNDAHQLPGQTQQDNLTHSQTIPLQEAQITYGHNVELVVCQTSRAASDSTGQSCENPYLAVPLEMHIPVEVDPEDFTYIPINDYNYYKEIEDYLRTSAYPSSVSSFYKDHIKKKSRHYLIINNELHHNQINPKKVIMKREDQRKLLELSHLSAEGVHLGIRKMMDKISESYFWRGMYEDVSNHVSSCPKCRDSFEIVQPFKREFEEETDVGSQKDNSTFQTSSVWSNCHHVLDESKNLKKKKNIFKGDSLPHDLIEGNVSWAVSELKTYLSETKETRRKRGRYQRYSVEIQEHMICYAQKNGAKKAAVYFSQLMGSPVSDSTIRNLLKSNEHFPPQIKEEIARHALEFGVEKTSEHFSKLLKKDVSIKLVKKFKAIYASRLKKVQSWFSTYMEEEEISLGSIDALANEEKEDLLFYTSSNKLQNSLKHCPENCESLNGDSDYEYKKECTIKCDEHLKNMESEKVKSKEISATENSNSLEIGNDNDSSFIYQKVGYQSVCINKVMKDVSKTKPVIAKEKNLNKISQDSNSSCGSICKEKHEVFKELPDNKICYIPKHNCIQEKEMKTLSPTGHAKINLKKRGKYITFSPEMRAKIGKYAAENGSGKASKYFSDVLGHELAESTVRGFKNKYLKNIKHCNVTSLGYGPRGRPLRLGKYDEVVQECLKEMIRSGEKLTTFLVITTAKKIIMKLEPGLLEENGGSIALNNTWAKSFLKRICVRNNT